MEILKVQKINYGIRKTLSRNGKISADAEQIEFIMDRFFHYYILALMHGIKCSIPRLLKFQMVYNYISDIPRKFNKLFFFSSRAFGYSFYLIAESKKLDAYGYTFRTDKKVLKAIADHNESDIIYKLLEK